jgi:hypothetical protein
MWEMMTRRVLCVTWQFGRRGLFEYKKSVQSASLFNFLPLIMSRPSRTQASRFLSSLSFAFFLFIALILLCPPSVSAEDKKSEYGTVIGIGTLFFLFLPFSL